MPRLAVVVPVALVLLLSSGARADEPKPQDAKAADAALVHTAQAVFKDLKTVTLENGLRVYLLPIKSAPVVSVMVAYRVGSGDEEKTQTGLSHYLEHLMFKGTEKLMPGDIDRITQQSGGQNNAYTSEDMTVYHFDFAANRWLPALQIEADRMQNLRIDAKHEFEQEKGAVISELNRDEDMFPTDLLTKTIVPLLFPKESPYSHPVIGEREHVKAATAAIIKSHYDKWYHPNNASLVMVGGFDADAALGEIKKLFGPIPKVELPARRKPTFFEDRAGPIHKEFKSQFDVPRMMIGFNTIAVGSPEDPVFDMVQEILGDGKTCRLYTKLVEQDRIASSVSAGNNSLRSPGWFQVYVELFKGKDRKKAEELVFAELEKLATQPVSDEELNRARRKLVAARVFAIESVHGLADSIARTSAYPVGEDVAKYYQDYLDRVLAVTKEDIQQAVKKYLGRKEAAIVWAVPEEMKPGAEPGKNEPGKRQTQRYRSSPQAGAAAEGGSSGFSLKAAKRVVLDNGLVAILMEDHRLPIVVADIGVTEVQLREPAEKAGVGVLTGSLLDEGTPTRTSQQIAAAIENTGGSLGFGMSGGTMKVLTPDTITGLDLLFDCMLHPTFPEAAFDLKKEQQLSTIDDEQTQPNHKASELFHALVYGKHPFGRPRNGSHASVEKLTRGDCSAFHQLAFAPNFSTVVVVGDFKTEEMVKKIELLTKGWKKSDAGKPEVPAPPKPAGPTTRIVTDPGSVQVYVYIGELGITRDNPDYYKLLVMDNVLGSGAGFTYRLAANLRDRQGWAYSVYASITSSAGRQPGMFAGYIDTFPEHYLQVRDGFLAEIKGMRDGLPNKAELDGAKQYLLGSLPFKFTTLSAIAHELLEVERYGLGFDYVEKFEKAVGAVSAEDVQKVSQKYLDPNTLTIVAVGAIDQKGQPVKKEKK